MLVPHVLRYQGSSWRNHVLDFRWCLLPRKVPEVRKKKPTGVASIMTGLHHLGMVGAVASWSHLEWLRRLDGTPGWGLESPWQVVRVEFFHVDARWVLQSDHVAFILCQFHVTGMFCIRGSDRGSIRCCYYCLKLNHAWRMWMIVDMYDIIQSCTVHYVH